MPSLALYTSLSSCCSCLPLYITLPTTKLRHSYSHRLTASTLQSSPAYSPEQKMTPISEREPKELEAQAATSHGAPIPSVTQEEEAATGKAKSVTADQENQAARRDLLAGIRKLIKSFKSLSHIFEIYKEEEEDDMDMNIEIGFPTDVQHVAHIGLDGSSNVSGLRGLEEGARELLSLSNLTMEQFERAVASLAAHKEKNVRVSPS